MSATLDLSRTLKTIARLTAQVLEAEGSSVLILDRTRHKLIFEAAVGDRSDMLLGEEFDADAGIAGEVLSTGQGVLVPRVREHPSFFSGIDDKTNVTTRDLVAAPLRYQSEIIGVVEALNRQAPGDFTERDLDLLQVFANLAAISVSNARQHERIQRENRSLRAVNGQQEAIGMSTALEHVRKLVARVADTDATVLLLGETGTGKEVTARAIHANSSRKAAPFVPINCAALPETLLESELFGHEAGAFTGATSQKSGRFELADGGTLFLDEIGDISLSTQIKLLRVLQEREFARVGGVRTIRCNVRIIAATNRDLKAAMESGTFREDLYYRLNVFPIHVPPLRERRDDVPLLVEHFVERIALEMGRHRPAISPEALSLLCTYDWPGNIRELRNVVERAVLLAEGGEITEGQLPPEVRGGFAQTDEPTISSSVEGYERAMIVQALEAHNWNQTRAAKSLGLSRDNLRYRLRKYDIRRPQKD